MSRNGFWRLSLLSITLACATFGVVFAQTADGLYNNERFELGDGVNPPVPGMADVAGDLLQWGPDWADVFTAQHELKDVYDEFGTPSTPNGVPDFLDTYGVFRARRDAAFVLDDVITRDESGDPTSTDPSTLDASGLVGPGQIGAEHDLSNAYAYSTFDPDLNLVIYAGVERLTPAGPSILELEFNQTRFSLSDGEIGGERSPGDMRVVASFGSGLETVTFQSWGERPDETFGWLDPVQLNGEECNAAGTACVVCNGDAIVGGDWGSYDASGNLISQLEPNTLLEVGVNVGALQGSGALNTRYRTFQIISRSSDGTPQDFALGYFARANFASR